MREIVKRRGRETWVVRGPNGPYTATKQREQWTATAGKMTLHSPDKGELTSFLKQRGYKVENDEEDDEEDS